MRTRLLSVFQVVFIVLPTKKTDMKGHVKVTICICVAAERISPQQVSQNIKLTIVICSSLSTSEQHLLMISDAGLASPLLLLVGYVGMADGERETVPHQHHVIVSKPRQPQLAHVVITFLSLTHLH